MPLLFSVYNILKPFIRFLLLSLVILSIFRFALIIWQIERVDILSNGLTIMFNGLRIDLSTLAYLLIIPALLHPFIILSLLKTNWLNFLRGFFWVSLMVLSFFECTTPTFILEYDLRPNRLFIEYLIYPKEVFSMLLNGHLVALISTSLGLAFLAYVYWIIVNYLVLPKSKSTHRVSSNIPTLTGSLVSSFLVLIILFGFARGTVGHRPINPSLVYFSTDPLVNSLTLNSLYSVGFAIKQLGDEMHAANVYGNLSDSEVIEVVRAGMQTTDFSNANIPTLHTQTPTYLGKPKNLVIILEESLGAQFVSHLGGKPITPKLDNLMQEGWAFNQLYATGTRSVRGIEAVVTGFTPTPARAVVKLANSQQNFFTIASLLKQQGYTTQFIYGGESHFDNMKSFFLGNGFSNIVDFDDIQDPLFVASWGADDESLFIQAHKELTALSNSQQPFFSLVFSSSNHDPFDIPNNIIEVNEGEDDRDRAIRFADYALGKFIDKAKHSNYWDNTLFLVVADHDARVFGAELVPIKSFHIPGVIIGKNITPKQDMRVVSQIDLAPTLLSLMGLETTHPMLGNDLTYSNAPERAMMQFDKNLAYMKNDQVAILQPNKAPVYFRYNKQSKQLETRVPILNDMPDEQALHNLGHEALGHALFGSKAYAQQWYRLETLTD